VPESFDLGAAVPRITLRAAYSKHRREDTQLVRRDLAELLGAWLVGKEPGKPVFAGNLSRAADMMKADLAAAGLPYGTPEGLADFHSLRVSFISHLVASGASVKVCQELARHSSPVLTFQAYARAGEGEKIAALSALRPLAALPGPAADRSADQSADVLPAVADGGKASQDDGLDNPAVAGVLCVSDGTACAPVASRADNSERWLSGRKRRIANPSWEIRKDCPTNDFQNADPTGTTPGTTSPAQDGYLALLSGSFAPDLAKVVTAWPSLSPEARRIVLALCADADTKERGGADR